MESPCDTVVAAYGAAKLSPSLLPPSPQLLHEQLPRPVAPVRIRIQRVYLSVISLTFLAAIIVLMALCANGGITLETFDSTEKDSASQATLVSQYNSYSGYLVSALTQPIELFFPMVIAVAFLVFRTEFSLDRSTAWQSKYTVLIATMTAMYLLNTGFSAINVQVAPQSMRLFMSARDLTQASLDNDVDLVAYNGIQHMPFGLTSNKSLREETAKNLLTNTLLRNSFLPEEINPMSQCTGQPVSWMDSLARYGFPPRQWHSNAFREAITLNQSVKFVLQNSTDIKFVGGGTTRIGNAPRALPMDKFRALNLVLNTLVIAPEFLRLWDGTSNGLDFVIKVAQEAVDQFFIPANEVIDSSSTDSDGSRHDLYEIPLLNLFKSGPLSNNSTDEDLIKYVNKILLRVVSQAANVSATEVEVEFTRTNLTTDVTFDAITLEMPLHKNYLNGRMKYNSTQGRWSINNTLPSNQDGDSYYEMIRSDCSPSACVLPDTDEYSASGKTISIRPQVMALAACWNNKSREDPDVRIWHTINGSEDSYGLPHITCSNKSSTSMYIISVGKRIQGDEITSRSAQAGSNMTTIVSLKNARKVYSITVGLLSWETRDLADLYGAKCMRSNDTMCHGLSYKLQSTNPKQHLLVGSRRLPADSLEMLDYAEFIQDYTLTLATTVDIDSDINSEHGMLVLPRNFENVSWPSPSDDNYTKCFSSAEAFVHRTVLNHLYIEKTLQPAYTAAFFYLFQDAAARDVLNTSVNNHGANSAALAFLKNVQLIDIKLSSPLPNSISTLFGACTLFAITVAIVICGSRRETMLQQSLDAHNIAEALINERKFPPLLLTSTIDIDQVDEEKRQSSTNDDMEAGKNSSLDGFRVERGVLTHEDGRQVVLDLRAKDNFATI
uniref:Uncharacterized protein n=1 Tax=Globisporangium ultimum (strain ATCC 200006 / CBS 805.95 / DAOM BR144) TaxID=431595 RepID=K3W9B3_GLOUD